MSEVTTQSAVADTIKELGITAPQVQDPIARFDASQTSVSDGQGETATAADAQKAEAEAKPDTTVATAAATDTKTEIPDVPQSIEEALSLTAEDFAEIENNPAAKKAYKMMLRDYRKKTGDLATSRKAFEAESGLMEQIKNNPRAAIQALASVAGVSVSIGGGDQQTGQPTEADPVKKALEAASKQLDDVLTPEGAKVLRPVLENLARAIAEETVAPLKKKAEIDQQVTAKANVNSTIKSFGAERIKEGEEWSSDIEKEMASLVGKIIPGAGMDLSGYVNLLYDNVMATRIRAAERKRSFERLKAAQGASEPVNGSRPAAKGDQSITAGMNVVDATRLAVAQSLSELRAGR